MSAIVKPIQSARRRELVTLAALFSLPGTSVMAQGAGRHLVPSIPVFPWLHVGQTTLSEVRGPVQSLMNASPRPWFRDGTSEITGGTYISVSSLAGQGVANEEGLRILTMVFDKSQRAQLAIFVVDKGWKDANVQPLIKRLSQRYASYAKPARLQDGDSDATDYYVFFDIGKFCIEIAVPQHGSNATVHFTTKDLHKQLRIADGSYELFKKHIEQMGG